MPAEPTSIGGDTASPGAQQGAGAAGRGEGGSPAVSKRYHLCSAAEIANGQARGFDPLASGRDTLFVVRKQGRLYAYRNACPHIDGAPMAWARHQYLNGNASRIVCSAHGAQFDIDSGVCLLGPCLGQSLERGIIDIATDGGLYVLLPAALPD